jgi:hypothetical protein
MPSSVVADRNSAVLGAIFCSLLMFGCTSSSGSAPDATDGPALAPSDASDIHQGRRDASRGDSARDVPLHICGAPPDGSAMGKTSALGLGASGGSSGPAIASDGTHFLVVWDKKVSDLTWSAIYAALMTASGTVSPPFLVSDAPLPEGDPAAVFGSMNYLVVWRETDLTGSVCNIRAARVDSSGAVLDPNGITIADASPCYFTPGPAVTFDGENFLVAWLRGEGPSGVVASRVSAAGAVLDPAAIVMPMSTGIDPAIASNRSNSLLVWSSYPKIEGARISQQGAVLDSAALLISTAGTEPAVTYDGTNYVVVWTDSRSMGQAVLGARVTAGGEVVDPVGFPIHAGSEWLSDPVIVGYGSGSVVAWTHRGSQYGGVMAARLDSAGCLRDRGPVGLASYNLKSGFPTRYPALSSSASAVLAGWRESRPPTTLADMIDGTLLTP